MAAVVVAPAATHGAGGGGGGGGGATSVAGVPAPSTLVPACAICCIAVSACTSNLVLYYDTFAVALVGIASVAWPDRVDAVLGPLDAYVRRQALLAREDLEADLRRLRDAARANRVTAPVCAGAEECARRARAAVAGWADGARRRAEAKWGEHKDAAGALWLVLRLLGRVVRLAGTVLLDAVCKEAKTQAPSVLGYLRGLIHGTRAPTPCKKGEEEEEETADAVFMGIVCAVVIGFYLLFRFRLFVSFDTISEMQFCAVSLASACGLVTLVADWIDLPDDSDEPDTTSDRTAAADDTAQRDGDGGEASTELEVSESWQFLWVLSIVAFCVDALLLHLTLGPRPMALALLAICNFVALHIGKQVQLTPDDGEGAAVVNGAVDKWRCGAMAVFAASSVKIVAIYLVLDSYLAALSFVWLCIMADLLLEEDDSFSELDYSGAGEEGAGSSEDVNGGVGEGADEARAEHSSTSSSEDEEEGYALERRDSSEEQSSTSSSEDEEEGYVLEEHCYSSDQHSNIISSEDEHLKEQQEEPDCGGSSSMDDGWDLVEVDPEMPVKDNCGANRKSSRILPWK